MHYVNIWMDFISVHSFKNSSVAYWSSIMTLSNKPEINQSESCNYNYKYKYKKIKNDKLMQPIKTKIGL